jgi:hypothetical protein
MMTEEAKPEAKAEPQRPAARPRRPWTEHVATGCDPAATC